MQDVGVKVSATPSTPTKFCPAKGLPKLKNLLKMKFALINGKKIEAFKGAKGLCQSCGAKMTAKCGELKVNHWAHEKKRYCDTWWETETEWHREWKANFPMEWQEIVQFDSGTKEKHIADICTDKELVVEFQHSHINPVERRQREGFYKNMIWIVDGTRLKRDIPRFNKAKEDFVQILKPKVFGIEFADECFPKIWLHSSVPVIFDFGGAMLYCIFPIQLGRYTIFAEISRKALIESIKNDIWQPRYKNFINKLNEHNKLKKQQENIELKKRSDRAFNELNQRLLGRKFTGRKRRF